MVVVDQVARRLDRPPVRVAVPVAVVDYGLDVVEGGSGAAMISGMGLYSCTVIDDRLNIGGLEMGEVEVHLGAEHVGVGGLEAALEDKVGGAGYLLLDPNLFEVLSFKASEALEA